MDMSNTRAIILAAGKGTRLGATQVPKVMYRVHTKPMLAYLIDALHGCGVTDIILVVGYQKESIQNYFGDSVRYAFQSIPDGTGHAVQVALDTYPDGPPNTFVLLGDNPGITSAFLSYLFNHHISSSADLTFVSAYLNERKPYGRVIRDLSGKVLYIKEEKHATTQELCISELFTSQYCFKYDVLKSFIPKLQPTVPENEIFLTDIIGLLARSNKHIESITTTDPFIVNGINTITDLNAYANYFQQQDTESN
jgi:bifunctional UDP-N-acetylglucosamine pyrophosphorylase / glucosamine-1-phosphate N-acetyltransferase